MVNSWLCIKNEDQVAVVLEVQAVLVGPVYDACADVERVVDPSEEVHPEHHAFDIAELTSLD